MLRTGLSAFAVWLVVQWATKQFLGAGNQDANTTAQQVVPAFDARPSSFDTGAEYSVIPQNVAPIWAPDTSLDISMYISPSIAMPALASVPKENLVLEEKKFQMSNWNDNREIATEFAVPKEVQNNGTLWAHFYVGKAGSVLDPMDRSYDPSRAYHFLRPLNQYLAKKKVKKTKKLLEASSTDDEVEEETTPTGPSIVSYYHPNFTVSVIPDSGIISYPQTVPAIRQFIHLETTGARDGTGQNTWYYPVLFVNTFWQLRDHMTELNSTVKTLPLRINLGNLANWKFTLYATIDDNVKSNAKQAATGGSMPASGDGSEFEEFKRILVDTNIYLLATTGIVSIFHMVFEMLAFKSDVVSI
jgi:hypothetical protein